MKELLQEWNKYIKEIQRIGTIPEREGEYDRFVLRFANTVNKLNGKVEEYKQDKFAWAEKGDIIHIISYKDNDPVGYLALKKFKDAWKVYTIGIRPHARKEGIASKLYDFVLSKTKLYSDSMQTPSARKLWIKFHNKYNIYAVDVKDGKKFDVEVAGNELKLKGSEAELYSNKDNEIHLVIDKQVN